jgi:hypothetical protein
LGDTTLELPGKAENALLANLHGTVEVNTGDGEWTAAKSRQSIQSGQQVRTGALSSVTLVFYDGSQTYLGADAEIAIDMLDATRGPSGVALAPSEPPPQLASTSANAMRQERGGGAFCTGGDPLFPKS